MALASRAFVFKAQDLDERTIQGTLSAPSLELALRRLQRIYPKVLMLRPEAGVERSRAPVYTPRVGTKTLAVYTRQLAAMVGAGISITRALRFLTRGDDPGMNFIMGRLLASVEEGNALSAALAEQDRVFSETYVALVKAGEKSGTLEKALAKLADLMEKVVALSQRLVSTFAYPAFIAAVCALITGLFAFYIMPMMTPMFTSTGMPLPLPTRILLGVTSVIRDPRLALPTLIFLGLVVWRAVWLWRLSRENPEIRYWLDLQLMGLPVVGSLLYATAVTRVLFTMSTLMDAGVTMGDILPTLRMVANHGVLDEKLRKARQTLLEGTGVYRAMELHQVLPGPALQMIKVGEETGSMAEAIRRIALFYEAELDLRLDNLATLLEPLIMAVMGAVVGLVVLATMLPVMQLLRQL